LDRAGFKEDSELLLKATAVFSSTGLAGTERLTGLAIGAWITAVSGDGDAGLYCLYELKDRLPQLHDEVLASRLGTIASEATARRMEKRGLKRPTPPFLLRRLLENVKDPPSQRVCLRLLFPALLQSEQEARHLWGDLTLVAAANEIAAARPSEAIEMVRTCDFDNVLPAQRSFARSLAASALARAHRIRDARAMASVCDPDDRLVAYAAVLKQYAASGLGRFMSKLWTAPVFRMLFQ
jgi:hypothetical protein